MDTQNQENKAGWSCQSQSFVLLNERGGDFLRSKGKNRKWQNKPVLFSICSLSYLPLHRRRMICHSLFFFFFWLAGWRITYTHIFALSLTHTLTHMLYTFQFGPPLCDLMNDTPISITASPLYLWLFLRLSHSSSNYRSEANLLGCIHLSQNESFS